MSRDDRYIDPNVGGAQRRVGYIQINEVIVIR